MFQPWPIIERFLKGLEPGSVGLDVGCGNGKYLAVNRDIFIVGSDRYAHNFNTFRESTVFFSFKRDCTLYGSEF